MALALRTTPTAHLPLHSAMACLARRRHCSSNGGRRSASHHSSATPRGQCPESASARYSVSSSSPNPKASMRSAFQGSNAPSPGQRPESASARHWSAACPNNKAGMRSAVPQRTRAWPVPRVGLGQILGQQHGAQGVAGGHDGRAREAPPQLAHRLVHVVRECRAVAARAGHRQACRRAEEDQALSFA